jgi:UDP-N-acetylglucosamine pyrophosphorylase
MGNFAAFETKMVAAGMREPVIRAFERNYRALLREESGLIPEGAIVPVEKLPSYEGLKGGESDHAELLSKAVVIKLNGGLGTGMGLQGPKSLLRIHDGATFLDLIIRQILELRKSSGTDVRLLLMNSYSTSAETLAHLSKYHQERMDDPSEVELMQNQIPKIDAKTMEPVQWTADPSLEWCPPGHGDLYPALVGSGWLDRLLSAGINFAFVSNSDNLGAVLDPVILRFFADSGAPFLMEVTRRTAADRKGGHLALLKTDRHLLLRELAQCPDEDLDTFQDIARHRYFNTNSLWIRLDHLKEELKADHGVLPLPMIRNVKTVDPRDKTSTTVVQLETAMGAAIECFRGALAIDVPRSRFAPVKTTADLLALRSDAYEVMNDGQVRLVESRNGVPPIITLSEDYKLVDQIEALGLPSLIQCQSLTVKGPVHFHPGVILRGTVAFENASGETLTVKAGIYEDQIVRVG